MSNRCGTIGCRSTPTHKLIYSFPESRETTETDVVCLSCGMGYVRRPALKASIEALPVDSGTDYIVTLSNNSGRKELVIRSSRQEGAWAYAQLVCEHQPGEYAGYVPVDIKEAASTPR